MGLMQLMPQTARELRVKNAFNPEPNGDAGVPHLRYLLENYNGAVNLTLAAYRAGSAALPGNLELRQADYEPLLPGI